ncbi:MAG: MlaD family protein, partial [Glaciecola sp.]
MEQSAKVTQQRRISFIWAIPAIALMIAAWMLYQYQAQQGILIQINAKDADGIIAGKTEIRVHSVNVGMVESVNLDASHSRVIINALIEPQYATLLNKTTEIWVVKPRVDLTGVSGLGTLFSGFYLEM